MSLSDSSHTDSTVERALKTDPIHAAEKVTGKSYKDDEATSMLGLLMSIEHNESKRAILGEHDDTHFGITWLNFLRIIEEEGFIIESLTDFDYEGCKLHHLVAVHPDGIIIVADSFRGSADSFRWSADEDEVVNSAEMYYRLKLSPDVEDAWKVVSSGSFDRNEDGDSILSGHHDIREGFRHNLGRLRQAGTFLSRWSGGYFWIRPNVNFVEYRNLDRLTQDERIDTYASVPAAYEIMSSVKDE